MLKTMIMMISLIFSQSLLASTVTVEGLKDTTVDVSRVQKQVTLIQSVKGESDLRVSFVVMDSGGSTDLSPRARLYLTVFNESEMKDAKSAHMIASINSLVSSKRIEAGVYEAIVTQYDYSGECGGALPESMLKITVDARQLTADVRKFKGAGEFDVSTVQTPITITKSCI